MTLRVPLLLALAALITTSATTTALAQHADVDARLRAQLAAEGLADVLVVYGDYPDLSGAYALATKEEKGAYVYAALRQNATRHRALTDALSRAGVAHRNYWVANAVLVYGADAERVRTLASEPGVARLAALPDWSLDVPDGAADPADVRALQARSAQLEWGLRYMGVPEAWAAGVRGAGAVVGGQDTGYDWDHPALKTKYRGYVRGDSAVHDYNWHDAVHERSPLNDDDDNPCGFDVRAPCDDGSHGTHTMGTMVGSDGANEIGVAPDAEWIGCRSMERGWGRPETYLECFQWFVAPTDLDGENARPDLAPDVIANSWYCPLMEGCDSTTYPAFDNVIEALRAAGVVVVVSAGNAGRNGCATVNRIPAQSPGVIAVGAHDSLGVIADFSSRGSADAPADGVDLVAPGVAVRSSVPSDGYRFFNGTSMAGPHVAGVVALMVSARPELRGQVDTIEALLLRAATYVPVSPDDTCSDPDGPNVTYGAGYAQAMRAVELAQAWGGVSGTASAKTWDVSVAPNPVDRGFTLVVPAEAVGGTLLVRDALGRPVWRQAVGARRVEVLTGAWARGTYVYEVRNAAGVGVGRVVKR